MYEIVKDVVSVIKNYHGYPGVGKETRWYIVQNGKTITDNGSPLWFYRKKNAKAYIEDELT